MRVLLEQVLNLCNRHQEFKLASGLLLKPSQQLRVPERVHANKSINYNSIHPFHILTPSDKHQTALALLKCFNKILISDVWDLRYRTYLHNFYYTKNCYFYSRTFFSRLIELPRKIRVYKSYLFYNYKLQYLMSRVNLRIYYSRRVNAHFIRSI